MNRLSLLLSVGLLWGCSLGGALQAQSVLSLTDTLLAADPATLDRLGSAVGIADGWVALGAPLNDELDDDAGAVYLYQRQGDGSYQFQFKLFAPDGVLNARFGGSIAMAGDLLVVGAPRDPSVGQQAGAVYLFGRDVGGTDNWGLIVKRTAPDPAPLDYYGTAVALWDTLLLVGRPNEPFGPLDDGGSAYLYAQNQGGADNWGLVRQFLAGDAGVGDTYGAALALDGTTVLIGAPLDNTAVSNAGSVYHYSRDAGGTDNWGLVEKLSPTSLVAQDQFGTSVALGDDLLFVGAIGDDTLGVESGLVWGFERSGAGASFTPSLLIASPLGSADDQFGQTLLLRGDTLYIGAPGEDLGANDAGTVFLFGGADGTHLATTSLAGAQAGLAVGSAIASDGSTLLAGVGEGSYTFSSDGGALVFALPTVEPPIEPLGPIRFFPNPTSGLLTLQGEADLPLSLTVYGADGRREFSTTLNELPATLPVGQLKSGLYILHWESASGARHTQKFMVE